MKFIKEHLKIIVIAVIAVVISIIALAYYIISPYYSNKIEIVDKPTETSTPVESTEQIIDNPDTEVKEEDKKQDSIYKEEKKADEIFNVVLVGVDTRSYNLNSRSDSIILASYNKTQHSLKLVSFMRDSWVHLPERGWGRINTATVYGGTGLLINTINENFDLDVQNYVQIKFDDFRYIIDAIGGIDVELSKDEINYINRKLHSDDGDWDNDIKADPGIVHLNGAQALWHCRNRSVGNSDYERTERQREVIEIIMNKLLDLNLGQATRLVFDLRNHVNTNVPLETIFELGKDALLTGEISTESARVPFDGEFWSANKNGASVLELDIEGNTEKLHEFLGYKAGEEETGTETAETGTETDSDQNELKAGENIESTKD